MLQVLVVHPQELRRLFSSRKTESNEAVAEAAAIHFLMIDRTIDIFWRAKPHHPSLPLSPSMDQKR